MASIPVTIQGVMTYSDVGVGGGPMPGGPEATHPIAPGGPPPQVWPGPGQPAHPIVIPPDAIAPGIPTHPIVIPQPPLGIWGGGNVPMPTPPIYLPPTGGSVPPGYWGGIAPPLPTHPIAPGGAPPSPTHPIVLPPIEPGGPPVQIWPSPGHPAHPIVLPPLPPPPTGSEGGKPPPPDGGWGYHPDYGWGYFPPVSDKPIPAPVPPGTVKK
jgi:hypothetical protein